MLGYTNRSERYGKTAQWRTEFYSFFLLYNYVVRCLNKESREQSALTTVHCGSDWIDASGVVRVGSGGGGRVETPLKNIWLSILYFGPELGIGTLLQTSKIISGLQNVTAAK